MDSEYPEMVESTRVGIASRSNAHLQLDASVV